MKRQPKREIPIENLEKKLQTVSGNVLRLLGFRRVSVSFFLVSDREMRALERKFLGREKGIPNVLSFSEPRGFPHPERKDTLLGEVYLNRDLYLGQYEELSLLLIHGILHLVGYNHARKNDMMKMEKLERQLMKRATRGYIHT